MAEDKDNAGGLGFLGTTIGVVSKKRKQQLGTVGQTSIATPDSFDGSFNITASSNPYVGGTYSSFVDIDSIVKNDQQAIATFRQISTYSDCERAIDEIVNTAIVKDPNTGKIVDIDLTLVDGLSDNFKEKIRAEFNNVMRLYNFNKDAKKIFRQWYIDGKIFYRTAVDEKNLKAGILKLELLSPLKIMRIRETKKKKRGDGIEIVTHTQDYYIFNDNGLGFNKTMLTQDASDIKIPVDNIIDVDSGWRDMQHQRSRSFLLGAIRPVNILKMMEDAVVIYRMTRAPERKIWYIDTSEMPDEQAEQYTNKFRGKFRNRITYNSNTGQVTDKKRFINAVEDYFIPRRGEGKGTEVTTLPGAQNLGEMGDLTYFQEKVWDSLKVPSSRLKKDSPFSSGRGTAISQEEMKFQQYIQTIRESFSETLLQALERQLLLKEIVDFDTWDEIRNQIAFKYVNDALMLEQQRMERYTAQAELLGLMTDFKGDMISRKEMLRGIRGLTDEEIEELDAELDGEVKTGDIVDRKAMNSLDVRAREAEVKGLENPPVPAGAKASSPKPKPKPKKT